MVGGCGRLGREGGGMQGDGDKVIFSCARAGAGFVVGRDLGSTAGEIVLCEEGLWMQEVLQGAVHCTLRNTYARLDVQTHIRGKDL